MIAGLARAALTIAAILVAVFLLVRVIPGDVVEVLAAEGDVSPYEMEEMRAELGLDRSAAEQFAHWLGAAAQGEFGESLRFRRPVAEMLAHALPATLRLAAAALAIGLVLGIALPVAATLWPRSPWPGVVHALNVWSIALPTFCVALGAILLFSVWLKWWPVLGNAWVPALVIGIDIAGQIAKPLHEDLKEAASAEWVRTAHAKGLSPGAVVVRHMLPNALPVTVALSGLILAGLVGGTLTMEALFGLPGLGTLALQAIQGRDYPVLQAVIVVLAVAVVAANAAADLLARALNPRPPPG